ncbi:MAG TPA: ATP-binding protein [Candidatus Micrarchaeia archaeon]|nr:ATP-binding protein [Candidatus Micrarchaeia archaeon]
MSAIPVSATVPQPQVGFPPIPQSAQETGLPFSFVNDLVLKVLYFNGGMLGRDLARHVCLPWVMAGEVLKSLSNEGYCGTTGVRGTVGDHEAFAEGLQYLITEAGRERAREVLELSQYAGPAPVPLDVYIAVVRHQSQYTPTITHPMLRQALEHLVLAPSVYQRLGPGLSARQAIFLYGPPGNGKTTIADACAGLLGDPIFVPHALYVHGEVIRLFDPVHHHPVEWALPAHDTRWMLCHRPVVRAGGELNGRELELGFDSRMRFYEAPLQLKANGGLFLIDDFGRQSISPRDLLNRLIVPLEAGYDFLNIARAGTTVAVPFTEILMLSTNIQPRELVDEAFLRRVRYKVKVPNPSEAEYREIFRRMCASRRLDYDDDMVTYLIEEHYRKQGRTLHGCHPRDLVDHLIHGANYFGVQPELSKELLDHAASAYFADLTDEDY